ncbi:MAG: aldo/keto reductase [Acidibacillus sp.]|nr:aldo/keto reductase [Acidibacillus sp.]
MKYRRLGQTELKVSVVGLGTWQFGGEWGKDFTQSEVDDMLALAKELGINFIDTAECYGDHLSESLIGQSIARERGDWVIATKFGHKYSGHASRVQLWSPSDVLQQLEDSLRALQTDYIDIYQFHSGSDGSFDQDDLWTLLDKQVLAGKIRHLGISLGNNDNLHQTNKASDIHAKVIQVVYNRIDQKPEERVFPSCISQDLGVLARVPLASGFLSGKYQPTASFDQNDVRGKRPAELIASQLQQVEEIKQKEVPAGIDMAQWALAWCLQHPAVTSVIPGCKNIEQVELNAKAADLDVVSLKHPSAWE